MIKYFYVQLEFIQYESYMISSRTDFYAEVYILHVFIK